MGCRRSEACNLLKSGLGPLGTLSATLNTRTHTHRFAALAKRHADHAALARYIEHTVRHATRRARARSQHTACPMPEILRG
eukprot:7485209-Alexandrium_andersonii.AAC.1